MHPVFMDHSIFVALGSNLGDRLANLRSAVGALPPQIAVLASSPVYETAPWGVVEQPVFLNMAVRAKTRLSPQDVLHFLKALEVRLGREPSIRWGPRRIDLDLLFYDTLVLDTPELVLPHPRLQERAFVLVPLSDLAPEFVHPQLGRSVQELLDSIGEEGIVRYGTLS
jgi:2-amino-4-hydroxy-6-hydroxymethyldihydropteridine diphosphokinase